ncbi:MAG: NUDIX domain-containing protein [Candidatus Woesearchaeota archaeon]|nr:MAG: NUDIX domain-containing protein [Candidatus Woesearchaeota archaeon]
MLVEKRKITKRVDPGKVCIPSGGIETGETPQEAVCREAKEEFGINDVKATYIGNLVYPCSEVDFLVNYFIITEWIGEIEVLEAEQLQWKEIKKENVDIWPDKLIIGAINSQNNNNNNT